MILRPRLEWAVRGTFTQRKSHLTFMAFFFDGRLQVPQLDMARALTVRWISVILDI